MAELPLAEQIKAVEDLVAQRAKSSATMDAFLSDIFSAEILSTVKSKVVRENAALEAALETLRGLERRPEPCPGECGHTDAEHIAFDAGVAAGERGEGEEACPYGAGELREAWLTGHSVGSMNGGNDE